MAGPFRTPQKYTFHTELRGARGVITNLNAISRTLNVTRLAATKTFSIDRQIRAYSVQMGQAANAATRLSQASLGLANATGASVDQTTKLITAYQRTGNTLDTLTGGAENTTNAFVDMTDATHETIRAQVDLIHLFGMTAESVVELERQVGHLGINYGKLLGGSRNSARLPATPIRC